MKIYVDADGVIFDIVATLDKACEKEGHDKYDYSNWILNNEYDDVISKIINKNVFWKNIKCFEDAYHQLNSWFLYGHNICAVSERNVIDHQNILNKSIDDWRVPCSLPVYSDFGNKYSFISDVDNKNSIFIEDNPFFVEFLKENNMNAVLRRAWYNSEYWDDLPSVGSLYELNLER